MTTLIVGAILIALSIVGSLIYTAIFGSVTDRVGKELGLEESESLGANGRWNGRDVRLGLTSTGQNRPGFTFNIGGWSIGRQYGYVAEVEIAAVGPCRLRACHVSRTRHFLGGPPTVQSSLIPDELEVWCDSEAFVQQIFSNSELRERFQIALRSPWDLVEINTARVLVQIDVSRYDDGDYSALFATWNAARVIVEGMGAGIPDRGALPAVEFYSTFS